MRGLRADDVRSALRASDTDDEASDAEAAEGRRWVHTDEICDEMCDSTCCNPAFTGPCGLLTLLLLIPLWRVFAAASDGTRFPTSALRPLDAPERVDVVYMWVNGSDPVHDEALKRAQSSKLLQYRPHTSRFRDEGIFEYALRSLLRARRLMARVRHVYIVTAGEVPSWLPLDGAAAVDGAPLQAHALRPPLRQPVALPLRPLVAHAREHGERMADGGDGDGGGDDGRLIVVPHAAIFPNASAQLPTFNSNAILAALPRLPLLAEWFLYVDDDIVVSNPQLTLDFWWDAKGSRQRVYLQSKVVVATRRPTNNNWEQAMTYMASLLDAVTPPTALPLAPPPPPPSPPPPPPPPTASTSAAATAWLASLGRRARGALSRAPRWRSRPPARVYAKPQHMPVLFSRSVVGEMERRWPADFEATLRHRLRAPREIELNFLYSHYLRLQRFPVALGSRRRVGFVYLEDCATEGGARRCKRELSAAENDVVCFNDRAGSPKAHEKGAATLRAMLRQRFGSFGSFGERAPG